MTVEKFLKAVEMVASDLSDRDKIRVAANNMEGSARMLMQEEQFYNLEDWQAFKTKLAEHYPTSEDALEKALESYEPLRLVGEFFSELADRIMRELDCFRCRGP